MKVLVVDDVGYSRHYHTRLLQKFGFEAQSVETGPQALKILEHDMTIGAVLTDFMMREMDGVELFHRSQRINRTVDGKTADPPAFILMTALRPGKDNSQHKDLEKVRTAKDIGFLEVLFKPIEPEVLINTLETIRYARSRTQIDIGGVVKQVGETIDRLIAEKQLDDAGQLLDGLKQELERLDQFVLQPV